MYSHKQPIYNHHSFQQQFLLLYLHYQKCVSQNIPRKEIYKISWIPFHIILIYLFSGFNCHYIQIKLLAVFFYMVFEYFIVPVNISRHCLSCNASTLQKLRYFQCFSLLCVHCTVLVVYMYNVSRKRSIYKVF